ncbi:UDP-N-acetylglucosamine 1-carboxyvinyltransferase [Desulfonatronum thiosulfatophilum]|uniref:UDP-N-acetylglucosamine 1-carboxyvinyltransferase n=1 Tax=Desulfonatronum thiosulfatophilum TaxID=617002 RepID=A0A1G6AWJ2_9BACT|nr:UDP-N-acetylglucosamine 1-carboxyvinyltransferase [Desulfonatronum thiosulfatophilum]SDB12777.1 UDP-N-acetylglucosamine 1-carboxyvinyltransferase [Desulfonatronum thiosulfatophilum]
MDKLVIEGNVPLRGRLPVSGSKNAALPILLACILAEGSVRLRNVPKLRDISTTLELLRLLGCEAEQDGNSVETCVGANLTPEAPYDLVRTMRASVLCLGPLLARLGKAVVALPGGCAIGSRPVDLHLRGLERMGAHFDLEGGNILGRCDRLRGAHIHFDFPTVGGTENLLMAASLAEGETILENAAREPEVVNLADFLNACGARIQGQGTSIIRIQGVERLTGAEFRIMPDRIEAGTYLVAAVITDGELYLENCSMNDLDAVVYKLREMGVWIQEGKSGVLAKRGAKLVGVDLMTQPFPGFPTDMQAQVMTLMGLADGSGVIKETIFENRFMHVQELVRMGAQIKVSGQNAMIRGVTHYNGAPVMASDLRASASLVLAGLAARGTTEVRRIYHLDRGYEELESKLSQVGARIRREAQ